MLQTSINCPDGELQAIMNAILQFSGVSVETSILEAPSDVVGEIYKARRTELEAERLALKGKLEADILLAGISGVNQFVGKGMGVAMALSEQDSSQALGGSYEAAQEIEFKIEKISVIWGRTVTEATLQGLQLWLDYQNDCNQLTEDIEQLDSDMMMSWFGQGGTYTVDEGTWQCAEFIIRLLLRGLI